MVNVIIYLEKKHNAKELVKTLLSQKLIASASIDENNVSFELENDLLSEKIYNVITAHSKSLLFSRIVKATTEIIGEEVQINSVPIVASNELFDTNVRTRTLPV